MKIAINMTAFVFIFVSFFIVFPIFTFVVFAEGDQGNQKFNVSNNDNIVATISEKELSRIVFENDEVERIYSINGEFNYEILGSNLYLRPVATAKPINFFVETGEGKTYQFLMTIKDIPAVQIFVKNIGHKPTSKVKEQKYSGKYTSENLMRKGFSKIISAALADDKNAGFAKKKISLRKKFRQGISIQEDSVWKDDRLVAVKYYLQNTTDKAVLLNKNDFLENGFDGVYLEADTLKPEERTVLIIIKHGK
jgi:type-F conjugative transfer system secretin TraK